MIFSPPTSGLIDLLTCDLSASSSAPDGGTKQRRQGQDVDQISAAFPNNSKPRRGTRDGTEVGTGVLELNDFLQAAIWLEEYTLIPSCKLRNHKKITGFSQDHSCVSTTLYHNLKCMLSISVVVTFLCAGLLMARMIDLEA